MTLPPVAVLAAVPLRELRVARLEHRQADLGFGRIVASEIELSNMFANLV
jgi:hypothetical protein